MKLQISYDFTDLEKAIEIAKQTAEFADILEVGSPLILSYGSEAVKKFKETFPDKLIFADAKIVDRASNTIKIFTDTNADYISVLAETNQHIIKKAAGIAHENKSKIALDMLDTHAKGQIAMDAKNLDIDVLILHTPHDKSNVEGMIGDWDRVRGNTDLPIFLAGGINKKNISQILELKAQGVIIGTAITKAENPAKEAEYFKSILT